MYTSSIKNMQQLKKKEIGIVDLLKKKKRMEQPY